METLEERLKFITETILRYVPANQIFLFGSYAYGKPNEDSDIDIMVIVPDQYEDQIRSVYYPKIIGSITEKKIYSVHLVFSLDNYFNNEYKDCNFEKAIKTKGKLLYAA